jgi:hypothetical protein
VAAALGALLWLVVEQVDPATRAAAIAGAGVPAAVALAIYGGCAVKFGWLRPAVVVPERRS